MEIFGKTPTLEEVAKEMLDLLDPTGQTKACIPEWAESFGYTRTQGILDHAEHRGLGDIAVMPLNDVVRLVGELYMMGFTIGALAERHGWDTNLTVTRVEDAKAED